MAPTLMADRSVRDKSLAWAMVLLFSSQVLHLIADSIRLPLLLESRVSDADKIAGWLNLIADLPLLAAASFGLFAFLTGGNERAWWLRRALLLATLGLAIAFIASVFDYAAIEDSPRDGMNLALLAACVAAFAFCAGLCLAVPAASKAGGAEGRSTRNAKLRWSSRLLGIALLSTGLSSWAYTLAYSTYPHNAAFTRGLIVEGFGAVATGLSLLYAATAFGREAEVKDGLLRRERRLFLAACAIGVSLLLLGLGEAQRAAGITALGYLESAAVSDWTFAIARICEAAAFLYAARGFKFAAARPG
jgi:hypothetical protein